MGSGDGDRDGWIEKLVRVGGALGLNEVRLRWKLLNAQRSWERFTRGAQRDVQHIRYEHKICPRCGALQDRKAKTCSSCSARLRSHAWQVLSRIGVAAPRALSPTNLLGFGIVLVYLRAMLAQGTGEFWNLGAEVLYRFGGLWPPDVWAGQWWRLGSAVFLHAGAWHIGFNLLALSQVGPRVEEVFGRARMLVFFMLTGVLSNFLSLFWMRGIGIGASGAIMGLVGVAAGWGQRDGTAMGQAVRNGMIQWGLYTVVFGVLVHANNVAHVAGFLSGGILGYAVPPVWHRRGPMGPALIVAFVLSLAAAVVSVGCALFPHVGAAYRYF